MNGMPVATSVLPAGLPLVLPLAALHEGLQHHSAQRTLTESDLVHACMLSGDWHEIHASQALMRGSRLGERIFPGTFGVMLAVAQAGQALQFTESVLAASGILDWKYQMPLRMGASVRTVVTVRSVERHASKPRAHVLRHLALIDECCAVIQSGFAGVWVSMDAPTVKEGTS